MASQATLPLQVQRPIRGPDGAAVVTLLCPAGALFEGDDVTLTVECGPGVDVVLIGTAATKLNRCEGGSIRFDLVGHLAEGARLRYLPHELIPLRDTVYDQRIQVRLGDGAEVQLLEVVTPGLLQEPFAYERLVLATEVRDAAGLLAVERLEMHGREVREALGGHSHYGSLLVAGPDANQAVVDQQHEALAERGVYGSASLLARRGWSAKALGRSAISLRHALLAE